MSAIKETQVFTVTGFCFNNSTQQTQDYSWNIEASSPEEAFKKVQHEFRDSIIQVQGVDGWTFTRENFYSDRVWSKI